MRKTGYENDPQIPDADTAAMLEEFPALLRPSGQDPMDPAISLCISKLLLKYYRSLGNPEKILYMLQQCATYDLILMDHRDDHESTPYAVMAMQYLGDFDSLSENARHSLIHCMVFAGYNCKDLTYGLKKFREYREILTDIRHKMGLDDYMTQYRYILFKINALYACLQMEDAARRGVMLDEPLIDIKKEAPLLAEFRDEPDETLKSEKLSSLSSTGSASAPISLRRIII